MALTLSKPWTGQYETDFRKLLPGLAATLSEPQALADEDAEAEFSLLSGTYKATQRQHTASSALVERNEQGAIVEVATAGSCISIFRLSNITCI